MNDTSMRATLRRVPAIKKPARYEAVRSTVVDRRDDRVVCECQHAHDAELIASLLNANDK